MFVLVWCLVTLVTVSAQPRPQLVTIPDINRNLEAKKPLIPDGLTHLHRKPTVPYTGKNDKLEDVNLVEGNAAKIRMKRSKLLFLTAILEDAKFVLRSSSNYVLFSKTGGIKQAQKDFWSLNPTNVRQYQTAWKGKVGKSDIDLDFASGHPTVNVLLTKPAKSYVGVPIRHQYKIQYFD